MPGVPFFAPGCSGVLAGLQPSARTSPAPAPLPLTRSAAALLDRPASSTKVALPGCPGGAEPALRAFGATMLVGVALAFALAPWAAKRR